MTRVIEFLTSPWLTVRVQIALGVLFVAAALPKVVDPPSFAQMIYNYRLVPGGAINALALVMPWVEMLAGMALIFGIWRRSAAITIGGMLVVFIIAIGINLAREHPVDCGCFEVNAAPKSPEQLFTEMRDVIVRDIGMLLMVGQVLWATGRTVSARAPRVVAAAELSEPRIS
ncbi:MAG: MauE/DoxX family redox-associated membrane protein [Thermoanaerobaculia bacterium]